MSVEVQSRRRVNVDNQVLVKHNVRYLFYKNRKKANDRVNMEENLEFI